MQAKSGAAKKEHAKEAVIKTSADVVDEKETATVRAKKKDEEGKKVIEKVAVIKTRRPDTIHFIEKKLVDKGVQRLERHPVDGLSLEHPPPKSGHGGKFTWEGPGDVAECELDPAPPAIDPKDPNYVDERVEELLQVEVEAEGEGPVVGKVEVAKVVEAKEGVSRIEVDPLLQPLLTATD